MPNTVFNIEDGFATISRFVSKAVLDQLIHFTSINDVEIIFNEPLGVGKNSASNTDPDAMALKLDAKDYLIVTCNERFDQAYVGALTTHEESLLVFKDSELGLLVKPITAWANIEFSIVYRSKSYNTLSTWLNRFQRNKLIREPFNYHNLTYNYTLPGVVVAYLYDCYQLTQNIAPPVPAQTLKEYYAMHYTKGLMARSNLNGVNNAIAINVAAKGNLGWFSSLPEDIRTETEKLYHEVEFTYNLQYDKVTDILLEYQMYIHNQRIDDIYIPYFKPEDDPIDTHHGMRAFSGFVNTVTEKDGYYKLSIDDIFFDDMDTWLPTITTGGTTTMLMVPIQLDPLDLRLVLDLNDVPTTHYPVTAKDIIMYFWADVCKPYLSPFMIELYEVGKTEKPIPCSMDINGLITSNVDLDLRKRHYIRISLLIDLSKLPISVLIFLSTRPGWLIFILHMIDPTIKTDGSPGALRFLAGGTRIDLASLWDVLNKRSWAWSQDFMGWNTNVFGYYVESSQQSTTVVIKRRL